MISSALFEFGIDLHQRTPLSLCIETMKDVMYQVCRLLVQNLTLDPFPSFFKRN